MRRRFQRPKGPRRPAHSTEPLAITRADLELAVALALDHDELRALAGALAYWSRARKPYPMTAASPAASTKSPVASPATPAIHATLSTAQRPPTCSPAVAAAASTEPDVHSAWLEAQSPATIEPPTMSPSPIITSAPPRARNPPAATPGA